MPHLIELNPRRDDGIVVSCGSSTSFVARTTPCTLAKLMILLRECRDTTMVADHRLQRVAGLFDSCGASHRSRERTRSNVNGS